MILNIKQPVRRSSTCPPKSEGRRRKSAGGWDEYVKSMEKMGCAIETTQKEYDNLTSTRTKQLDRSVGKLEDLKSRKEIEGK